MSLALTTENYAASFGVIAAKSSGGDYFYIGTVKD